MKFQHLTDKQYFALAKMYVEKGPKEYEDYMNFLYNAVERYVETGDFSHLNHAVKAGRATQRFRKTMRVIGAVAAHKFSDKMGLYYGSAESKKLAKLRHNQAWIGKIKKAMSDERAHERKKPEWNWSNKKAILIKLVKEATEHGVSVDDIEAAVRTGEGRVKTETTPKVESISKAKTAKEQLKEAQKLAV